MLEKGTITRTESGVNLVFEWKIENFFNLPETDDTYYTSPDFSFGGERWYLFIYPNGSRECDSSGQVDLGLWKYFSGLSIKQSFSFSLKTTKGEKYNEHFLKNFWKTHGENYHELLRFIPRLELTRRRSELVPEDVLTVVCTMKYMTSAGNASNTASASGKCCHCKITFNADILSSHQKKCVHRPVKCPDCLEVVVLQTWFDEHECQQERPGAGKEHKENSENTGVNASTQTEEKDSVGSLCEDYKKVLLVGRHYDLILKVGDKELRAHRDVLRVRSKVFESMLDHDMKEKNSGIIDVPDCDPNAMEIFLSYVYCGKIEALDHNNMLGLYYVADKYEMMELKRECCNFINNSLSLTNICSVIQLALKHSDSDLLEYATGYFSDNMLDIMQTVEWQSFLKDNSTVGNELLMKSIKKLKNAQT